MSYADQIEELAAKIAEEARDLRSLQKSRASWLKPEGQTFDIGSKRCWVVNKGGAVSPIFASIQREAVKLHDEHIIAANSRIEGLRFKLVNLAKNGGAA